MFPGQAPSGFDDLIQRKYNILQQNANAQSLDAAARANLANAQAGSIPATTAANVEESKARGSLYGKQGQEATARSGLYGAQAESEAVRNAWYPNEAAARIALDRSSSNLNNSNALAGPYNYSAGSLDPAVVGAAYSKSQAQFNGGVAPMTYPGGGAPSSMTVNSGAGMITQDDDNSYRRGTARVPGRGPSNVDSVKAKLAPKEAVLNAPAADMMGRGLIAHANALGMARMGMVDPRRVSAAPAGYKRGTSGVGMKKAPPMDAAALTAFLRTMGGGAPQGGMPEAAPVGPGLGMMGQPGMPQS